MGRPSIAGLALRNLKRRPFRTFTLILAIAIATTSLFSSFIILRSVEEGLQSAIDRLGADLVVVPAGYERKAGEVLLGGEPSTFYMDSSVLREVREVPGVEEASPQIFLQTSSYLVCCEIMETLFIAFDPDSDFTVTPWIESKLPRVPEEYVITGGGIPVYENFSMYLYGHWYTVYARLHKTGLRYFDSSIFIPMELAYSLAEESQQNPRVANLTLKLGKISAVLVRAGDSPEEVAERIESRVPGVSVVMSSSMAAKAKAQAVGLFSYLIVISGVLWIANLLMISATFATIAGERRREFGLLRAVGARRRDVAVLMLYEAGFIGTIGAFAGLLAGLGIFLSFREQVTKSFEKLLIPFMWPDASTLAAAAGAALASALLMAVLGASFPALGTSREEPYTAIRMGER
ncbi:MAG: ABC transporter permease [Euryarchaeota archaeon]|nr:ABC transporter permease [Euryarchaeota archaeon]